MQESMWERVTIGFSFPIDWQSGVSSITTLEGENTDNFSLLSMNTKVKARGELCWPTSLCELESWVQNLHNSMITKSKVCFG